MNLDIGVVEVFGILVTGFVLVISLLTAFYVRRRGAGYDEELNRVKMELFRKSIEREMAELNDRLMSTESRWRDANHLLISSQDMLAKDQFALSSKNGRVYSDSRLDERMVFVLTPFNADYIETFSIISRVCSSMGLRAVRGDEEFIRGEVFPHILDLIERAGIVVANIDGRNPNVFYELGIAQALGKRTILISKRPEDVPFDIRTNRIVIYESNDDLYMQLQLELSRAVIHGGGR